MNFFTTPRYILLMLFAFLTGIQLLAQTPSTVRIPRAVRISREGRLPLPAYEGQFLLSGLAVNSQQPVFPAPCLTGQYYVGFQLLYDLGDNTTTQDWTADLEVNFLHGTTLLWTKPLRVAMSDQTFISTVFHDTLVSCDGNYLLGIKTKNASALAPQGNIYLKVLLYQHFDEPFSPATVISLNTAYANGKTAVTWNDPGKASVAYDLEWVFIADHENFTGTTAAAAFAFKAPVRITTANRFYEHVPFYPKGRLWYRVRALGYNPTYPTHRIAGQWFYPATAAIALSNPQDDKTWQRQTGFVEDGKNKQSVSYLDGSLRPRQQLINLSTEGRTLVGESLYDYEGRKSVDVMSVPATDASLTYRTGFHPFAAADASVVPYTDSDRQKFHYDNRRLENTTLLQTVGAGQYYSPNNVHTGMHRDYTPRGEGYVYSQTEYLNDGTGRVSRQGGVGRIFRIDTSHAIRQYYGAPAKEELIRLFGSNVGEASHYQKNLAVDANGQVSVSYLDQEGRTIATALAGEKPANVQALTSYTALPNAIVGVTIGDKNQLQATRSTLTHSLLNVSPNTAYTFRYDLSAYAAQVAPLGCQTCAFDLELTLTDPEGKRLNLSAVTGNQSTDPYRYARLNLMAADCANPAPTVVEFTLSLPDIGDYTLSKTLTPHELSFAQLRTLMLANSQVQTQITQLEAGYTVDPQDCAICTETCSEAETAIETAIEEVAKLDCENIKQQIIAYYEKLNGSTGEEPYVVSQSQIESHPAYCEYLLCSKNQASDRFEKQLARVNTWTAALTKGYQNVLDLDPFFNDVSLSGNGYKASALAKLNDILVATIVYDSNGDGTADGSKPYRGTISQVTDPANTAFYIDENGNQTASGKHILYLDLMSRRSQLGETEYQKQLNTQRWTLYKSFYLEAKRKTKLEMAEYTSCAGAKASLELIDGLPQTPQAIADYGAAKGATGPVSAAELEMSIASIRNGCAAAISAADSASLGTQLQTYFNSNPQNYFRLILTEDLNSNAQLAAIQTILQKYNCSLSAVAVANPLVCSRDTTLYLPLPQASIPQFPTPPTVTPPAPYTTPPAPSLSTLQEEYNALWAFYDATGGANWTNRTGWATASRGTLQSVSGWAGITINAAGRVTWLNMPGKNLVGTLPAQLGKLTELLILNLSDNQLTGTLPTELGNLRKLTQLNLNNNQVSGSIPPAIGDMSALTNLELSSNLLSGSLPTQLGNLANLQRLYAFNNLLTGSIPASLGNLKKVYALYLNNNQLSGSIPTELGGMEKLQSLDLSSNRLVGSVPVGITAIATLTSLNLLKNQFTFSHLLGVTQSFNGTSFSYAPQDSVDVRGKVSVRIGQAVTFTANVDRTTSPASLYQWFKFVNGTNTSLTQPSTTGYSYTIASVTQADMNARYYYKITNTGASALTLVSRLRSLIPFNGWTVNACLAYDSTNVTLQKFSFQLNLNEVIAGCMAKAAQERLFLIEYATAQLIEQQASAFYASYQTQCLSRVGEKLGYRYVPREYHYTLYYFNQAGNLVQTVPPEGVKPLTPAQASDFIAGNRMDPPHTLLSKYAYNSLNALIEQKTPDGGKSNLWYNTKGQVRLSQNAEQQKDKAGKKAYSYTRYDEQGRVMEVGELLTADALSTLTDSLESLTFPLVGKGDYQLVDRTITHYDFGHPSLQASFKQQYLRSRVAWTEVLEKDRTDKIATYYSYDVHGNVKSLLQQLPGLNDKRTDYRYDLISGKVNYVFYQYNKPGELTHRYSYDADNRLTEVFTSSDGFLWNQEARYQYYLHGPLARVELGQYRVQAQDYTYTLQGWTKGVNQPGVATSYAGDPGKDGLNGSKVGKDVYAYSLGYYQGDYQPLNAALAPGLPDSRDQLWTRLQQNMSHKGLYNGNISWMLTDLAKIGELANDRTKGMQAMLYGYDQLNRIVQSKSLTDYNATTGFAARASGAMAYDEAYSYDGNGNLLTLQRRDETAALQDNFNYQYYLGSNKLKEVKPNSRDKVVSSGKVITDNILYRNLTLKGSSYVAVGSKVEAKATEKVQLSPDFRAAQGADLWAHLVADEGTYQYDAIGNLILDQEEGVQIQWTPYGKIRQVNVKGDSLVIKYRYDASGNRVEKQVVLESSTKATRYVRDVSGNVMGIYQDTTLTEQPLYGSSRLGEYKGGIAVGVRKLGLKNYELGNHLGNVLAVVSDKVVRQTDGSLAKVNSVSDFYSFGLAMKGRTWSNPAAYRYGFNGKEKDEEGMGGGGSTYDYGFRIYNPRIAKFLSVDPLTKSYPFLTPYQFAANMPIVMIDLDGLEPIPGDGNFGRYIVFGSPNQVASIMPDKRDVTNKNWIAYRGKNLGEVKMQLQNHKDVAEMVYIQAHGSPGTLFMIPGDNEFTNDITDVNGGNPANSVGAADINAFLKYQQQLREGDQEQQADARESLDNPNNKSFQAISDLQQIAGLMKEGGTLILGACNSAETSDRGNGAELMQSLQKLTGNRINIYMPQDWVTEMNNNTKRVLEGNVRKGVPTFLDATRSSIKFNLGWSIITPTGNQPAPTGQDIQLNSQGNPLQNVDGKKKKTD